VGPGVFVLTDSDLDQLLLRGGLPDSAHRHRPIFLRGGLKPPRAWIPSSRQLAEHLGVPEARRLAKYLADHCVVRWLANGMKGPSHFAHFVIAVFATGG